MALTFRSVLSTLAPTLGAAIGGPFGGAAGALLSNALTGKEGSSEEEMEAALAIASPDKLAEIKRADADYKVAMAKLGIDHEKLAADDRASAREREKVTGDKATPRALASIAVLGFFGVLGGVLWKGMPLDASGQIMALLIGTLTTIVVAVYNYYFGSSAGSKAKDALMVKK